MFRLALIIGLVSGCGTTRTETFFGEGSISISVVPRDGEGLTIATEAVGTSEAQVVDPAWECVSSVRKNESGNSDVVNWSLWFCSPEVAVQDTTGCFDTAEVSLSAWNDAGAAVMHVTDVDGYEQGSVVAWESGSPAALPEGPRGTWSGTVEVDDPCMGGPLLHDVEVEWDFEEVWSLRTKEPYEPEPFVFEL